MFGYIYSAAADAPFFEGYYLNNLINRGKIEVSVKNTYNTATTLYGAGIIGNGNVVYNVRKNCFLTVDNAVNYGTVSLTNIKPDGTLIATYPASHIGQVPYAYNTDNTAKYNFSNFINTVENLPVFGFTNNMRTQDHSVGNVSINNIYTVNPGESLTIGKTNTQVFNFVYKQLDDETGGMYEDTFVDWFLSGNNIEYRTYNELSNTLKLKYYPGKPLPLEEEEVEDSIGGFVLFASKANGIYLPENLILKNIAPTILGEKDTIWLSDGTISQAMNIDNSQISVATGNSILNMYMRNSSGGITTVYKIDDVLKEVKIYLPNGTFTENESLTINSYLLSAQAIFVKNLLGEEYEDINFTVPNLVTPNQYYMYVQAQNGDIERWTIILNLTENIPIFEIYGQAKVQSGLTGTVKDYYSVVTHTTDLDGNITIDSNKEVYFNAGSIELNLTTYDIPDGYVIGTGFSAYYTASGASITASYMGIPVNKLRRR